MGLDVPFAELPVDGLEIETAGGVSHWGTSKMSDISERKQMIECFGFFFDEAYNRVEAYQTVENLDGRHTFDK